jgi:hypothetical protein
MAKGHDNQLARQIGEHLVAAELGRQGFVAAPFAGNVPMYDLLAADSEGFAIPVQVKAIRKPTWQLDAAQFLEIETSQAGQKINGRKEISPLLVCVYVWLGEHSQTDKLYVFPVQWLQELIEREYQPRLPPKNVKSTHFAVHPAKFDGTDYLNNWQPVQDAIARAHNLDP